MKTTIVVEIDHHPATPGVDRVRTLLDFASGEYGIRSLTYTVTEEES